MLSADSRDGRLHEECCSRFPSCNSGLKRTDHLPWCKKEYPEGIGGRETSLRSSRIIKNINKHSEQIAVILKRLYEKDLSSRHL